jgi:hypothetical protein
MTRANGTGGADTTRPNLYERLCLDPRSNPPDEQIEQHFRELLLWWQKKLPLKNQPSNPLAQLLRSGLEESSRFLTEARVELLNPERRQEVDSELAAEAEAQALDEFNKYLLLLSTTKRSPLRMKKTCSTSGAKTDWPMSGCWT